MSGEEQRCSTSPEQTEAVGEELAARLAAGDLLSLEGDLAAGKTTLVRGLVRGLGGDPEEVTSPTFVILQSYACDRGAVRVLHHVDLYRLEDSRHSLREIGLEEVLSEPDAVVAIEWPRPSVLDWLPPAACHWRARLTLDDQGSRRIFISRG